MSLPRILKLAPQRDQRRLERIHRGYVELAGFRGAYAFPVLSAWGWLEKQEPVNWLDAYDGYRPTRTGLEHLHYDEAHHLILIRPSQVELVSQHLLKHAEVQAEAALVELSYEVALAKARGWNYEDEPGEPLGAEEAAARLERRGYEPLGAFIRRNNLSMDELVVAGVLRYLEHRDPEQVANIDVAPKAMHCLMLSTRWQRIFVRPGMAEALLQLVAIDEA